MYVNLKHRMLKKRKSKSLKKFIQFKKSSFKVKIFFVNNKIHSGNFISVLCSLKKNTTFAAEVS